MATDLGSCQEVNPIIAAAFCYNPYLLETGSLFFSSVARVQINLLIGLWRLSRQQSLTALIARDDAADRKVKQVVEL